MNKYSIPFNKPFLTGKELTYIEEAVHSGKISGDGIFTKKCHAFFENNYSIKKALMTTSCTDALELAALLCNIQPGDEVIMPSYTFVSTANAFVLRGATIRFVDSLPLHPNMDVNKIEELINIKTKAIVPMHYAGVACDMDKIVDLANKYNLYIVEDAAQAIDSYYKEKPLGTIGHFGTFSFHETKNIISGEGGLLAINDNEFALRAEILREKGTNRSSFFRGEVDKYGWVDIGSSFLPSEVISAFLYAQLENLQQIQKRRIELWNLYYQGLENLENKGVLKRPILFDYAFNNAHMFFILLENVETRNKLIEYLKRKGILAVFHYQSLHLSPYFKDKHDGRNLPNADYYSDCLLRLPLYFELTDEQLSEVNNAIQEFFYQD
ncbi:dTDP-4-amino-4,6-dideoxygalactose transaminase [Peijinzhouia sedimentorum]